MFCLETDSCKAVSRCFTSAEPKTLSCARSLAQEKDRVLRALFFTCKLVAIASEVSLSLFASACGNLKPSPASVATSEAKDSNLSVT